MSYEFDENFDVIVVGTGHAGVEAVSYTHLWNTEAISVVKDEQNIVDFHGIVEIPYQLLLF